MKIVIPVSASDKHLLPALTEILIRFGGLENHPIVICATPSAREEAYVAAEQLGITAHVFDLDFEGGWPTACSNHFSNVVFHLGAIGNTEPWLWMEPDMLPVAKGWADALQQEFQLSGKRCMGNVVPVPYADAAGNVTYQEGDFMLMGCAIYPPHMERMEVTKPLIYDLAKTGARCPSEPFDVYLRWPLCHLGRADTQLISDQWNTHNYRLNDDGAIECDPRPYDKPHRPRGGVISDRAVLVHGCKDGSLAELLKTAGPRTSKLVFKALLHGSEGAGKTVVAEKTKELLHAAGRPFDVADISPPDLNGEEGPHGHTPPTAPEQPAITHPSRQITREQILAAIGGNAKMKGTELAKKLGITHADLIGGVFPYHGFIQVKGGFVQSALGESEDTDEEETSDPDDLL